MKTVSLTLGSTSFCILHFIIQRSALEAISRYIFGNIHTVLASVACAVTRGGGEKLDAN